MSDLKNRLSNYKSFVPTTEPLLYSNPYLSAQQIQGFEKEDFTKYIDKVDPLEYGLAGLQEERAQNQSTADKWANATLKMGITAGTTFLDGTAGTLFGLGNLAVGGSFIDNPLSNLFANIQTSSEEWLPNYYTMGEMERPWYENLGTANFWADKVLKNFGFMIGTVASSMVASGTVRSIAGAKNIANKVGKGLVGKISTEGKLTKELLTADILEGAEKLRKIDLASQILGTVAGSVGEARIEALGAKNQYEQEIKNLYPNISPEELDKRLTNIMNATFLTNVAVLSLGNYSQFGQALSGGYRTTKGAFNDIVKGSLKESTLATNLPTTKMGKAGLTAWRTLKSLKNASWEGIEELSQGIASESSMRYFGKSIDDNTADGLKSYFDALYETGKETISDIDNYEEFAVGFISALLGMPNVMAFSGRGRIMEGGLIGDMLDYKTKDNAAREAVKKGNDLAKKIENIGKSAAISIDNKQREKVALEEGDVFEYKNAVHKEVINQAILALELGRFDEYISALEGQKTANIAELREVNKITKDVNGNPLQEPIDPWKGMTDSEVSTEIGNRINEVIKLAKDVQNYKKDVDTKFINSSEEVKREVIWTLSALDEFSNRKDKIMSNIANKYKYKDGRTVDEIEASYEKILNEESNQTKGRKKLNKVIREIAKRKQKLEKLNADRELIGDLYNELSLSSKERQDAYDKSENKLESEKKRLERDRKKLKDLQSNLADLETQISELNRQEQEAREKVIQELKSEDISVDEFIAEAQLIGDKIEEVDKSLAKFYKDQPQHTQDLIIALSDLKRIELARRQMINTLADAYDPKQTDKLQEKLNEEYKRYENKKIDLLFTRFKDGTLVWDTQQAPDKKNTHIKQIKEVDGKLFLFSQDDKGVYNVKGEELVKNLDNIVRYTTKIKVYPTVPEITLNDGFAYYTADIVVYKGNRYARVKVLTKDNKIRESYMFIINENGKDKVIPGRSFTITNPEKLSEVVVDSENQLIQIGDGLVTDNGVTKIKVFHKIKEFEDKLKKELEPLSNEDIELIDETDLAETINNEEAEIEVDKLKDINLDERKLILNNAKTEDVESVEDETKDSEKNKPAIFVLTRYVTDPKTNKSKKIIEVVSDQTKAEEIISKFRNQGDNTELSEAIRKYREALFKYNKLNKSEKEKAGYPKGPSITRTVVDSTGKETTPETWYINYPPAPVVAFVLTLYTKNGKRQFTVSNKAKVEEILKNLKTTTNKKTGRRNTTVVYGDKGLTYYVKPVRGNSNHNTHEVVVLEDGYKFPLNLDKNIDSFANIVEESDGYTATYTTKSKGETKKVKVYKPVSYHQFNQEDGSVSFRGRFVHYSTQFKPAEKIEEDPMTNGEELSGAPMRTLDTTLTGLTTNVGHHTFENGQSHVELNGEIGTTSLNEQLRLQRFTSITDFSKGNYVGEVVTGEKLYGNKWVEEKKRLEELGYNPKYALYAVIKKDSKYYIEKSPGVFEQIDEITKDVVFSSVPTYSAFTIVRDKSDESDLLERVGDSTVFKGVVYGQEVQYDFGDLFTNDVRYLKPKFANTTDKDGNQTWVDNLAPAQNSHRDFITKTLDSLNKGEKVELQLKNKSGGIGIRGKIRSLFSFLDENNLTANDVEIVVVTKDEKAIGGLFAGLRKGFIYLKDKIHGNIIELRPRTVNDTEAKLVKDLLTLWAKQHKVNEDNTVNNKDSGFINNESGDKLSIQKILQDLIGFGNIDNLTTEAFNKIRDLKASRTDENQANIDIEIEQTRKSGILVSDERYQIYLTSNPIPGGTIKIGKNEYNFLLTKDGKVTNEINPEVIEALKEFLPTKFIQISSAQTLKNDKTSEYVRPSEVEDGVLIRKKEDVYEDYNTFLINNGLQTKQVNYQTHENNSNTKDLTDDKAGFEDKNNKKIDENVPSFLNQYVLFSYPEDNGTLTPEQEKFAKLIAERRAKSGDTSTKLRELNNDKEDFGDQKKKVDDIFGGKDESTQNNDFNNFRLINDSFDGLEKIDEAEKWFKERFPNVDFNKVKSLVNNKGWGAFIKGAVYIYENAEIGTTYHEAFHVAFNLFMNKSERKALLDEVKNTEAFKDKIQKTKELYKNKSEDLILEEVLAEEFRNWKLNKGTTSASTTIKSFFKKLLDFIRGLITFNQLMNPTIIDVFNRIENGHYVEKTPLQSKETRYKPFKFYYDVENKGLNSTMKEYYKSSEYTSYIMNGVSVGFFKYFMLDKKSKGGITLLTKDKVDSKTRREAYNEALRYFNYLVANTKNEFVKKHLQFAIDNWSETIELHNQFLNQFKLEFKEYTDILDDIDSYERNSKDINKSFEQTSIQRSVKDSASTSTRLLVATLLSGEMNEFNMPKFVDFGQTFSLLANKLSKAQNADDVAMVISELKNEYNFINALATRLGMDIIDNSAIFNIDNIPTSNQVMSIIQFNQAFAKAFIDFQVGVINESGTLVLFDATKLQRRDRVINNLWKKQLDISRANSPQYYNKDGDYITSNFPELKNKPSRTEVFDYLKLLGITFTYPEKITGEQYDRLLDATSWLRKKIKENKSDNLPNFFNSEVNSDESTNIQVLVDIEAETNPTQFDSPRSFDGKRIYPQTLYSHLTYLSEEFNKIKDEKDFYTKFPHFKDDPYSKNSILKKRIIKGKNKIHNIIITGFREQRTFTGDKYSTSTKAERFQSSFDLYHRHKAFIVPRPADNSQERAQSFEAPLISNDAINTRGYLMDILTNYFKDEIQRTIDFKDRLFVENVQKNLFEGIMFDIIKTTSPTGNVANTNLYNNIVYDIKDGKSAEDILIKRKDEIEKAFKNFLDQRLNNVYQILEENGVLVIEDGEIVTNRLSEDTNLDLLKPKIREWLINDFIYRVEFTKLFVGDPLFYKHYLDFFKRMSGEVSPKKNSFTDEFTNKFIDEKANVYEELAKHHGIKQDNKISNTAISKTLKDENGNVLFRFSVFNDIMAFTNYFDKYLSKGLKTYHKMTKADGLGILTMDSWRQLMIRNGDWSFGKGSLEEFYQWELQHEMNIIPEERVYIDSRSGENWIINRAGIKKVANSVKPQGFGPQANRSFHIPTFEKLSFQILIPSLFMESEFSEYKKIKENITSQGVGAGIYHSGVKIGAELNSNGEFNSIYNKDGSINTSPISFIDIYYKNISIQQDTGNDNKNTSPTGVQVVRHIMNMIFDAGNTRAKDGIAEPIDNNLVKAVENFIQTNGERVSIGVERLKDKLGIVETEEGYIVNPEAKAEIIKMLQEESIKRDLPRDTIVAIEDALNSDLGIDVLVNRGHLENVLFSIADKLTITQKTYGSAKYQVAAPLFGLKDTNGNPVEIKYALIDKTTGKLFEIVDSLENVDTDKYDVRYTTPDHFYQKGEDGKQTKRMIAYIENPFDDNVDLNTIDERFKRIIGYRIPTQTPNSIESIEVRFLPKGVGDIILLPTEIVAKAGSDYDIDKLFTFFNNYYIDVNNQPVYIEFDNIEDGYDKYVKNRDSILANKIINRVKKEVKELTPFKSKYLKDLLDKTISDVKNEDGTINLSDIYNALVEEQSSKSKSIEELDITIELFEFIIDNDKELADVMDFNEFKLRATENKFRYLMDYILLHPDNFTNITTPISNDSFNDIKSRLLEPLLVSDNNYNFAKIALFEETDKIYEQFMEGAATIGIAALTGTFNVLAQIYNLQIPQTVVSLRDLANSANNRITHTKINLDHNSNGNNVQIGRYMSAENTSKLKDKYKKYEDLFESLKIPMVLSQWTNAAVDNAKELIMAVFNSGPDNLGLSLYLTMAGVPLAQIGLFMNQPVIKEFTKRKVLSSGLGAKATGTDLSDRDVAISIAEDLGLDIKEFEKWYKNKTVTTGNTDVNDMIENIEKNISFDDSSQIAYFLDFLRYRDVANVITNTIQKISYDNKSIGKNDAELLSKLTGTSLLANDIVNLNKILEEGGFLHEYYNAANFTHDIFGIFSPISKIADDFIAKKSIEFEQMRLSLDDRSKILQRMKNDYMLALIYQTEFQLDNNSKGKKIIQYYDELFNPKTGLYNNILKYQSIIRKGNEGKPLNDYETFIYNTFNNNKVINGLSRTNDDNVKSRVNLTLKFEESLGYESEQIREDWAKIINNKNKEISDFGKKLALFAIIQGGYNESSINFRQFIPQQFNKELLDRFNLSNIERFDELFNVYFTVMNSDLHALIPNSASKKIREFKKQKGIAKRYANLSKEELAKLKKRKVKTTDSSIVFHVNKRDKEGNLTNNYTEIPLNIENPADLANGSTVKLYFHPSLDSFVNDVFNVNKEKNVESADKKC